LVFLMNKDKRRKRKIRKFGKKLGIAMIFLVVSYLLSLLSFYLYSQLSRVLHPEEKGFLGFAIIGLIAGLIAVLISLANNRLILTIVISFLIDCLVDSIFLYSKFGIQVIQFLPGLLAGMSAVIALWHLLKRKLGLSKYRGQTMQGDKEQVSNKYILARKLIGNPNKITLEVFKEVCGLLQGIDPKIDAVLKKADRLSRTLTFLNGGDAIGFAVSNIKVKTKEDEEKKEKLLFFIDLVNDIREEISAVLVKINAAKANKDYIGHQNAAANTIIAASGPSGIAAISMTIVAATAVMATNTAGIGSLLPKNEFQMPKTQNSQEMNTPEITGIVIPSVTPTARPTLVVPAIKVDNGWGHFSRIFSGPPGQGTSSTIDYTTIAMYVTVHNNGTIEDRIIGGASSACDSITFDDMSIYGPDGTIPSIVIPAKSTIEMNFMKAGRIMCNGVKGVSKEGDRFTVALIFEKFGQVPVWIEVSPGPE